MKKILITINIIILFFICSNSSVYAATSDETWVQDAFKAASSFMGENPTDTIGISPLFSLFKDFVRAANRVLLVLLAGISTIALSVTGVRYLASGASPEQRDIAKQSLHTIFIGMAFGFGAFVIWQIAMGIVKIMITSFASAG